MDRLILIMSDFLAVDASAEVSLSLAEALASKDRAARRNFTMANIWNREGGGGGEASLGAERG